MYKSFGPTVILKKERILKLQSWTKDTKSPKLDKGLMKCIENRKIKKIKIYLFK